MSAAVELQPFAPVPDFTVLAAVERAELHGRGLRKGAARRSIAEHLGFIWHSGTGAKLKPSLVSLEADGCLELGRKAAERQRVRLTRRGLNKLQGARRRQVAEAMVDALPESPQHRTWRHAREAAVGTVNDFLGLTTSALQDAETVLLKPAGGSAEELMRIGDRLHREFWRLASATYCVREWPEPDEGTKDSDEWSRRAGFWLYPRREIALWADEKLLGEAGL